MAWRRSRLAQLNRAVMADRTVSQEAQSAGGSVSPAALRARLAFSPDPAQLRNDPSPDDFVAFMLASAGVSELRFRVCFRLITVYRHQHIGDGPKFPS